MTFGIVVFAIALTFSIALHELGHLATAKRFGMKATRYFVGFGPTLWSTHRGETEYGVKAFPLGGFVKIVGMTPLEEVDPEDEPRAFYRQPAGKRAIVLAAGSFMHFVLAFVLIFSVFTVTGFPEPSTKVAAVSSCVTVEPDANGQMNCLGQPASPAVLAGLRPGDRVVAFDGVPVEDWEADLTNRVRASGGQTAFLAVLRDGQRVILPVSVALVERKDGDTLVTIGAIGISQGEDLRRLGPLPALRRTFTEMGSAVKLTSEAIVELPASIPALARQAIGKEERTGDGPTSLVGAARFGGQAAREGELGVYVFLLAAVNIFVGVFNLLPLLPLDGGHLGILGFEQVRSRIARRRGRRDPGRVDLRKLMPATYLFLFLLVSLQILVLYADIANPIPDPFLR